MLNIEIIFIFKTMQAYFPKYKKKYILCFILIFRNNFLKILFFIVINTSTSIEKLLR